MERLRKVMLAVWIAVAFTGMGMQLTGCNTAEGFGEDMEEAGEGLQEEASE